VAPRRRRPPGTRRVAHPEGSSTRRHRRPGTGERSFRGAYAPLESSRSETRNPLRPHGHGPVRFGPETRLLTGAATVPAAGADRAPGGLDRRQSFIPQRLNSDTIMNDITGFRRDLLYAIAGLEDPHGLAIKEEWGVLRDGGPPRPALPQPRRARRSGARREGPDRPPGELLHPHRERGAGARGSPRVGGPVPRGRRDRDGIALSRDAVARGPRSGERRPGPVRTTPRRRRGRSRTRRSVGPARSRRWAGPRGARRGRSRRSPARPSRSRRPDRRATRS